MKISGKGIIIIIVFLILIPFLMDIFFATFFPELNIFDFSMSKSLMGKYIKLVPSYIGYLIVAFFILYIIKSNWKKKREKDDNTDNEQLPNNEQNE